jgi:hypothetical protein
MVFDKFPGDSVAAANTEEIPDGRTDIDSGIAVWIGFGCVPLENVLPVVCAEWAAVLPLGVTYLASVMDGYPASFANG